MEKKFRKYERIPHLAEDKSILDESVEVYEKIDGGNVQVRKIEGRVLCGSRANYLTREEFFTQEWFKKFQKWALGNYGFYNLSENLIVYGEWTAKHTLDYKPEFTDRFFLLDVFDENKNKFVSYNNSKENLKKLGIEDIIYLRTLFKGMTDIEKVEGMIYDSDYRDDEREGLVIKDYKNQRFAKLWASSVKQKNEISPRDLWKTYFSLIEEGKKVNKAALTEEMQLDLTRSGREISLDKIKELIEQFYPY